MLFLARSFVPVVVSLCLISAGVRAADWPLKGQIDFSDGFGDYRDGRFHAGLDLRTGGRIGARIYSPVNGSVYRLKTSYFGYGKGLYIKGEDGAIYVLGHLSAYAPRIDQVLKNAQYAAKRYYIDTVLSPELINVTAGELVAYSGQTGTTAPHLHFEKRITDENPVNPLTHGFSVPDKERPVLTGLGFAQIDDHSLFANGSRSWFIGVHQGKKPGSYAADSIPLFNSPVGVMVAGFDRTRPDGMDQAIVNLKLEIDNLPYYQSHLDTLKFSAGKSVYFEYDFEKAIDKNRNVRRLYHLPANQTPGSGALNGTDGVVYIDSLPPGKHVGRVTATDSYGNQSVLEFPFLTSKSPLFISDSTVKIAGDSSRCFFTPSPSFAACDIANVTVEFDAGSAWQPAAELQVKSLASGAHYVDLSQSVSAWRTLRLIFHSRLGGKIAGEPFSGLMSQGSKKVEVSHEVIDDGFLVTLNVTGPYGSYATVKLFGQDRELDSFVPPRFFNRKTYHFFIPVKPEYARIDSIAAYMDTTTVPLPNKVEKCLIFAVGYAERDSLALDSLFQLTIEKKDLPGPRFLELQKLPLRTNSKYRLLTNVYKILPQDFPTLEPLDIRLKLDLPNAMNEQAGICDFDFEKDRWNWVGDSRISGSTLTATTNSGGTFAAKLDISPPIIYNFSIRPRQRIANPRPIIEFNVIDSLSGMADDLAFDFKLDNKWMIPEYDPNLGTCTFTPPADLSDGDHHVAVKVTDRAGNLAEQYFIFTVATGKSEEKK